MQVTFALFADAANLSQEGKLNILGVFDALHVSTLPAVHPRANLVLRLKGTRAEIGSHVLAMRWLNPRGDVLWSSAGELTLAVPPGDASSMDLPIIASIDLPLDQPGAYAMEISLDDAQHASVPLHVRSESVAGPMMAPGSLVS